MTTITKTPRPRLFWHSAGDVMMRLANSAVRLDADQQADLLDLFDIEREAAAKKPGGIDSDAWIAAMQKHNELSVARTEAGKWARASGCVSDIQRRDAA